MSYQKSEGNSSSSRMDENNSIGFGGGGASAFSTYLGKRQGGATSLENLSKDIQDHLNSQQQWNYFHGLGGFAGGNDYGLSPTPPVGGSQFSPVASPPSMYMPGFPPFASGASPVSLLQTTLIPSPTSGNSNGGGASMFSNSATPPSPVHMDPHGDSSWRRQGLRVNTSGLNQVMVQQRHIDNAAAALRGVVAAAAANSQMCNSKFRGAWTKDEDKRLIEIVQRRGARGWTQVASELNTGRNGRQCRERWSNQINPDLIRSKWTQEEDEIILKWHAQVGNKWATIAKKLPGRTDNMVKNRFNGSLLPRQERNKRVDVTRKNTTTTEKQLSRRSSTSSTASSNEKFPAPLKKRPMTRDGYEDAEIQTSPVQRDENVEYGNVSPAKKQKTDMTKTGGPSLDRLVGHYRDLLHTKKKADISPMAVQQQKDKGLDLSSSASSILLQSLLTPKGDVSGSKEEWVISTQPCKCRRSKCLKLYCTCFAGRTHCNASCECAECHNKPDEPAWQAAVLAMTNRKPKAFDELQLDSHCKCKNTMCLKKYCDCYRNKIACGPHCECSECKNVVPHDLPIKTEPEQEDEETDKENQPTKQFQKQF